jgi:hypothetical protein
LTHLKLIAECPAMKKFDDDIYRLTHAATGRKIGVAGKTKPETLRLVLEEFGGKRKLATLITKRLQKKEIEILNDISKL